MTAGDEHTASTTTVSVVLATFNGIEFLDQQLESLMTQTRAPDEVVVVDDASHDATPDVLRRFADEAPFPVRLVLRREHRGTWATFEEGMRLADGDLVAICDQDDVWSPEKLDRVVAAFAEHPDALMLFSDSRLIDAAGEVIGESRWHVAGFSPAHVRILDDDPLAEIFTRQVVSGCSMVVRRRLLDIALPLPIDVHPGIPVMMYDRWLALVSATAAPVIALPEHLVDYRIHPGQQIGIPRLGIRRLAPRAALQASQLMHSRAEIGRRMRYHAAHFEEIGRRLDATGAMDPEVQARLDGVSRHLAERSTVARPRWRRLGPIAREYRRPGGYRRYSLGLATAVGDLLRP